MVYIIRPLINYISKLSALPVGTVVMIILEVKIVEDKTNI